MAKKRPVPTASLPQAHAWMPTSPCGPDCIDVSDEPSAGRLTVIARLVAAAFVVLIATVTSPALVVMTPRMREGYARAVFRWILRAFGIQLIVHGRSGLVREPGTARGVMQVSNHISWIDIVALNAVQPMRALAKTDLLAWPILSTLMRRAGTVFVDRERLRSLPATVAELAQAFRDGAIVNVAGEGTTWCGRGTGRYVPAPFQAAIDGGAAILPVAVRYRLADGRPTTTPAFIGTEEIGGSLLRVARARRLVVELIVCPEIPPGRTADRRELADLTEATVLSALDKQVSRRPHGQWPTDSAA